MKILLFRLNIKMLLKSSFVLNPSSADSSLSLTNKPWILYFFFSSQIHVILFIPVSQNAGHKQIHYTYRSSSPSAWVV